jgi:hypothetical protein
MMLLLLVSGVLNISILSFWEYPVFLRALIPEMPETIDVDFTQFILADYIEQLKACWVKQQSSFR